MFTQVKKPASGGTRDDFREDTDEMSLSTELPWVKVGSISVLSVLLITPRSSLTLAPGLSLVLLQDGYVLTKHRGASGEANINSIVSFSYQFHFYGNLLLICK